MIRRVYIQVAIEGDDAVERLIALGVPREVIHIEDSEKDPLLDAIQAESKMSFEDIKSKDSRRNAVMARTIYIHHAKKNGVTSQSIAETLGRDGSSIRWYLRHYDDSMQGDMEFKRLDSRIAARLYANPLWCPPLPPKPTRSKKKGRKSKFKNKN